MNVPRESLMTKTSADPVHHKRRTGTGPPSHASRAKRRTSERARTGPRCSKTAWRPVLGSSLPRTGRTLARPAPNYIQRLRTGTWKNRNVSTVQRTEICTTHFATPAITRTPNIRSGTRKTKSV